ncbi:MAG: hypothetical protein HY520_04785 [Candidatus Aenigmarchaeota archaeon]|nr:hypothetical protein [Candidatus Aenigmarchaeota archaeon]
MDTWVQRLALIAGPEIAGYRVEPGPAMAVHPDVRMSPFYPPGASFDRDCRVARHERLDRALHLELISEAGREDRQPRYAGIRWEGGQAVLLVGPTHFREVRATNARATRDPSWDSLLREAGQQEFGDEGAYFSNALAVTTAVASESGEAIVGRRGSTTVLYPRFWHVPGGQLESDCRFLDLPQPGAHLAGKAAEQAAREIEEEYGIPRESQFSALTGLVDGLSNVTFTYRTAVALPAEEILRRAGAAADAADHDAYRILRTPGEVHDFVVQTRDIVPAGAGALLSSLRLSDPEAFASAVARMTQYPVTVHNRDARR